MKRAHLVQPRLDKRIYIIDRWMSEAWRGVLSQEFEDGEHPILYPSRKCMPGEQKYAIIEKCLAIMWAVEAL